MNWEAIILTIKLASVVSVILVIIGIPIAYWLSFSRWRLKFLIEAVVAMPLILPPTVLGYYILIAISPNNPIGKLWVDIFWPLFALFLSGTCYFICILPPSICSPALCHSL